MLAQRNPAHLAENPGLHQGVAWGRAWERAMRDGDFATAWTISDAVLRARDPGRADDPALPYHERWVWDGRPFDGRRVLVRCYHGLGDTLQFCRYLAPLRARASHVTLEVQGELLDLLRDLPGVDRMAAFDHAAPLPPSECAVEIMELAHALRLAPDPAPYLRADALPGAAGGVGLCWRAGGWDPERGMPATALHPIAARVRAISLQRGQASADAPALGAADPLGGSMDVRLMARLIAGLDAVVTVDTMVAHLAGALGRPTHVLLKHRPDWRWGDGACAWYGSVRTARQPAAGDWAGAVALVDATLHG